MMLILIQPLRAEVDDIQLLIQQGQLKHALALTKQKIKHGQADHKLQFIHALILTKLGQFNKAIPIFTHLTISHPDFLAAYNNLAVSYAAIGQYQKAIDVLHEALNIDSNYQIAYENLGDIYLKAASHMYHKVLAQYPKNPNIKHKIMVLDDLLHKLDHNQITPADDKK